VAQIRQYPVYPGPESVLIYRGDSGTQGTGLGSGENGFEARLFREPIWLGGWTSCLAEAEREIFLAPCCCCDMWPLAL
jgi:hypothetical protein